MAQGPSISKRKSRHIDACLSGQATSGRSNGFERYRFEHHALPELDYADVDTSASFLGKPLKAPLMISPMTGGTGAASKINQNLSKAAQACGIAMGVGSQRAALLHPELRRTFEIRRYAPDIVLFANLGAVQLNNGMGVKACAEAVKMIEADALFLHLNPLQEVLQCGGDTNFRGLLRKIRQVCRHLEVPVFVREVSSGISRQVAEQLVDAGVAGIDVGGVGGTSWAKVEGMLSEDPRTRMLSEVYADWGFDVAESLLNVRGVSGGLPLIASGGIRTGLDVAKAVALGADLASVAAGLLKAATKSADAVCREIDGLLEGLKIALFCSGLGSTARLKSHFLKEPSAPVESEVVVPLRAKG